MVQDSRDLHQNAGATTSHTTGTTGTTGLTGTTGSRPDSPTFIGSGQSGDTGGLTNATGHQPMSRQSSDPKMRSGSSRDHREIVALRQENRPSTATIIGGALAGAIVGGALPFMLGGRSSTVREGRMTTVEQSIVINRPARDLYNFWREFTNLPQFMDNIKSVERIDERRSHWVIKGPAGTSVEFDSRVTEDVPNRLIAWQSEQDATVRNSGRVEFIETPTGGTNVRTTISYEPPAGTIGRAAAKLFGREPKQQAKQDLHNFKELMERGR